MKAFVSAQLTQNGIAALSKYAELKFGGWGYTGKKLEPEELVREAADCDILVICYEEINDYVLDNLPNLKYIACTRGGVENIDKNAVHTHGVPTSSAPGRNANAVAELTVGLMLCALRHIPETYHYIMSRQWERVPWDIAGNGGFKTFDGNELYGKTVGLVGLGVIGRRVAKLLSGFDVNLAAYDPFLKEWPDNIESMGLEELFEQADVISLHCKLTDATHNMVGSSLFEKMKPSAVFINTARGALVDEPALCTALADRKLACAALDAQVHEPMEHDSPFLALDNIILTPHIGGASRDIIAQQTKIVMQDIEAYFETGRPIHAV